MHLKQRLALLAICSVCFLPSLPLTAQQERKPPDDNTKVNQRDRAKSQPTADQGSNKLSDREIMQKIRKSVVDDKSLSTYAHNIKIIARSGKVTLKGPVRSEDEKHNIEQKAADVAGAGNVTSQITVKPSSAKKEKSS